MATGRPAEFRRWGPGLPAAHFRACGVGEALTRKEIFMFRSPIVTAGALALLGNSAMAAPDDKQSFLLTEKDRAVGRVVILSKKSEPLLSSAAGVISDTVRRWSGVKLPVEQVS